MSDADAADAGSTGRAQALQALLLGEVLAFPCEWAYGLGASAHDPAACSRMFALTGGPLTLCVSGPERLDAFVREVPGWARTAARDHWPGPLVLQLPARPELDEHFVDDEGFVALHAPRHSDTLAIIDAFAEVQGSVSALAGTPARPRGEAVATDAGMVREYFDRPTVRVILDGGPTDPTLEPTVLRSTSQGPRVVQRGPLGFESA